MTDYDDVYARITNTIIADVKKDLPACRKPWSHRKLDTCVVDLDVPWEGTPFEAANTIALWHMAQRMGYTSPFWMSAHQARILGAQVRSDEMPTITLFDDPMTFRMQMYKVFNAEQIDGLPRAFFMQINPSKQLPPSERITELDQFFKQTKAKITVNATAGYLLERDAIVMPPFECFENAPSYYAGLAHELIHWTRHPNRLNRASYGEFGDAAYAKEEIIAELGASFLMAHLGVEPVVSEGHAAYIKSWLEEFQGDEAIVLSAALEAREAVEYVKSLQPPTNGTSVKPIAPTPHR